LHSCHAPIVHFKEKITIIKVAYFQRYIIIHYFRAVNCHLSQLHLTRLWVCHVVITDCGKLGKYIVEVATIGTTYIANSWKSAMWFKSWNVTHTHTHKYGDFIGLFSLLRKESKQKVGKGVLHMS
jgi:hypothetical protein